MKGVFYVTTVSFVEDPILSLPIWTNSTPSVLIKLTVLVLLHDNTILQTPDKYSQHKEVCIRPTNIVSREANRERCRNTRHGFTGTS
jgi:hypothetical protein